MDEEIIVALYEAAAAGVKIDLIVRGVCCLRPGMPGVSENIRVLSIIGRFLEHSRIYYFGNGGKRLVYLGSADWMQRNFDRRVEVVFPVEDEALKARVTDEILPAFLSDNVKARVLRADGTYERRRPGEGETTQQAQLTFRQIARKAQSASVIPITPPAAFEVSAAIRDRPLRVAMLAPIAWSVPPRGYGPWELVTSLLTEGLVRRGVDVTLFATADSIRRRETRRRLRASLRRGPAHGREGLGMPAHRGSVRAGAGGRVRPDPQPVRFPAAELQRGSWMCRW